MLAGIIALGVAVFLSVRLANRAAIAGFSHFTEAVTGQSDFAVTSPAGVLSSDDLRRMREALGPTPVHLVPVLEARASRPRKEGEAVVGRESFRIVGIDLVASGNLLTGVQRRGSFFGSADKPDDETSISAAVNEDNQVWVSEALARRDGLSVGDELVLIVTDSPVALRVAGTIPEIDGFPKPDLHLLVMDLPRLQALAERKDRLDRVEIVLPPGPRMAERRTAVRSVLEAAEPERWTVETPANRRATGETMTAAFRLNLTVLSLIALLVGLLLILQALDGAVIRRRQEIAILKSLGFTPRQLQLAWLAESAAVGVVGSLLGIGLGWLGAQVSVRLVAQTVNALYYATTTAAASPDPREIAGGFLAGVAACVIAGWIPARSAAATLPAQLLPRGHVASGLGFLGRKRLGVALIAAGVLLAWLPPLRLEGGVRFPLAGYLSALFLILGSGAFGGTTFGLAARALSVPARVSAPLKVAISHLRRSTGRHRLAACGLVAAVGMTAGMIILVASFDKTVRGWISENLQADLFVASDGAQDASATSRILPQTWRAILAMPEVAGASLNQGYRVRIDGLDTWIGGFESAGEAPETDRSWIERPDITPREAFADPTAGFASESFCARFGITRGSIVEVPTPAGRKAIVVHGVFADYGNERGSLLVARNHLAEWFGDESLINMAIHAAEGVDPAALRAILLEAHPGLRVLTHASLRREILQIFRQTFSITYALELIGVVVAVAGLALTLASMLLDRRAELTTLRALGFSRRELAAVSTWEGSAIALVGLAVGMVLSIALGYLLIFVINRQSFGWTLQFVIPWMHLAGLAALVFLPAVGVSWMVGRWGAALPADREES